MPPGFTISTEVCAVYQKNHGRVPESVKREALAALAKVETLMGARFGDPDAPLLVSVRSGARVSMPGMMDTILNLGLNDATVKGLARRADERFAYDSYRRFISMYGDVVLEIPHERFESRIEAPQGRARASSRTSSSPRTTGSASCTSSRRSCRSTPGVPSRRTRRSSSGARWRRVPLLGEHARAATAGSTASRRAGAPP